MKNYKVGDKVYLHWDDRRLRCPAEYIGMFKDKFGIDGWAYYFKPVYSPKPYAVVQINANELDGETTELIPFNYKPDAFGEVKC